MCYASEYLRNLAHLLGKQGMKRFKARLVPGHKVPYKSWTFIVVPTALQKTWNKPRFDVRGTINGLPFRGTVSKGEGVYRMPVRKELLKKIGAARGTMVNVVMELDTEPRRVDLPEELKNILKEDTTLAKQFDAMPPSLRSAWSEFVGEAKRPETRARRAMRAPDGIRARLYPNQ